MTALFKNKIIPWLLDHEGREYEDDPDDPGNNPPKWANQSYRGTKYGIDARSHPNIDIKNLTEEKATEIYWSEWLRDGCDHLPYPLDWAFFDACVNCGMGRANEFLKASGNNAMKLIDQREAFYRRLADSRPSSKKFLKGWLARCEDLRKQIV